MRMTVVVRSTAPLERKIKDRTARQRQRVVLATAENAKEVREVAESLCPEDSGYMKTQLKAFIGGEGDRYAVGFRAEDFVGKENPFTNEIIKVFYPPFPIYGTRYFAGDDFLTSALRLTRRSVVKRWRDALNTR